MEANVLKTVDSTNKPRHKLRPSRELRQAIYDLWCLAREEALREAALRAAPQTANIAKRHAASGGRNHPVGPQVSQAYKPPSHLTNTGQSGPA